MRVFPLFMKHVYNFNNWNWWVFGMQYNADRGRIQDIVQGVREYLSAGIIYTFPL